MRALPWLALPSLRLVPLAKTKRNRVEPACRPNSPGTQHLRPIPLAHGTPTSSNTSTTKLLSQPSLPAVGIPNLAATIATVRTSSTSTSPAHLGLPPLELGAKTEASWLPNAHARFTSARSPVYSPERCHAIATTCLCCRGCVGRRPFSGAIGCGLAPPAGRAPARMPAQPQRRPWPWHGGLGTGSPLPLTSWVR